MVLPIAKDLRMSALAPWSLPRTALELRSRRRLLTALNQAKRLVARRDPLGALHEIAKPDSLPNFPDGWH
jgi:hypothetical protein